MGTFRTQYLNPLQASLEATCTEKLPFNPYDRQLAKRYWFACWQ